MLPWGRGFAILICEKGWLNCIGRVGKLFCTEPPQFTSIGGFGFNQFAYMLTHNARDFLVYMFASLISLFKRKRKISVYCSDVLKVSYNKLMQSDYSESCGQYGNPKTF